MSGQTEQAESALALVFARNAFYRRMHYLALLALVLSVLVVGVLIWMLSYLKRHPTQPLYFATDEVSRLIDVIPVDRPNMPIEQVVSWTVNALQKSFSFDFVNYRGQLQSAQRFFNNYGWDNYMKAITASNNLLAVTQNKYILIAQVASPPKLVAQGILGWSYAWKFELQMLITVMRAPYDGTTNYTNPWAMTVVVQRQPILQSDNGLGIVQVVANIPLNQTT